MKGLKATFSSEAMLCRTFLAGLPDGWIAYPETAGFDLVLVRKADGVQVGVEAKLTLNAKVLSQIVEERSPWYACRSGPDFRAALVPYGCVGGLRGIASLLGITVIEQHSKATFEADGRHYRKASRFSPALPEITKNHWFGWGDWVDWAPHRRLDLPDYVPDVGAGHSAPLQLTDWKIKAIKLLILLERRGHVTRADFKHLDLSHYRWVNPQVGWLGPGPEKGQYVATEYTPILKQQHPKNWAEIEADFEKWRPKE